MLVYSETKQSKDEENICPKKVNGNIFPKKTQRTLIENRFAPLMFTAPASPLSAKSAATSAKQCANEPSKTLKSLT